MDQQIRNGKFAKAALKVFGPKPTNSETTKVSTGNAELEFLYVDSTLVKRYP